MIDKKILVIIILSFLTTLVFSFSIGFYIGEYKTAIYQGALLRIMEVCFSR